MTIESHPSLRRLRAVCVVVCGMIGPVIGTAVLGLATGTPRLPAMVDVAGVPFVVYAVLSMAVPGAIAGALASRLVATLISRGYASGARRRLAPALGPGAGAGAGFMLAIVLRLDPGYAAGEAPLGTVATITGALCGSLIAAWVLWVTRGQTARNGSQHAAA